MRQLLFILLAYCVVCATVSHAKSNPVLVVSFGGFRADKLDQYIKDNAKSNFAKFAQTGIKAEYMTPQFPSTTFANHMTLMTGLYPGFHGIIGNSVYDPDLNLKADFVTGTNAFEVAFWNKSEPIWSSVRRQNLTSAAILWPGSDVWPQTPDIYLSSSLGKYTVEGRVDELMNWMTKFKPDLSLIYFNQLYSDGSSFGPDSALYSESIKQMDTALGYLMTKLSSANITNRLNMIILGDQGIAQASINSTILVSLYCNMSWIDLSKSIFTTVSNVYAVDKASEPLLFECLSKAPNVKVFYRNSTPSEYRLSNTNRLAPILVVCEEGFTLTTDPGEKRLLGLSGYNNTLLSMRTVFMASGPSFKKGRTFSGFSNIDVYSLLCTLTQTSANTNNGSIKSFETVLNSARSHFSLHDLFLVQTCLAFCFYVILKTK